jgi:hypothetical protein
MQVYGQDAQANGREEIVAMVERARHGMLQSPCDVVQEPTSMLDAIRRVRCAIPDVTPFATLEHAREDLRIAEQQLKAMGVFEGKSAHASMAKKCANNGECV